MSAIQLYLQQTLSHIQPNHFIPITQPSQNSAWQQKGLLVYRLDIRLLDESWHKYQIHLATCYGQDDGSQLYL